MFTNRDWNSLSLPSLFLICLLALSSLAYLSFAATESDVSPSPQQPLGPFYSARGHISRLGGTVTPEPDIFQSLLGALDVLQTQFFEPWQGTWPTAIDWTAAVMGTYVSAALATISKSSPSFNENLINRYFSELVASYFGQDAFALRQEAYDDMLWVVLGWLESIKFINVHSALHYSSEPWYGTIWTPVFAHRARLFWDLASQGWNTSLCGGGMIWSPYLEPYKNAITNELYITASISMYLFFPGDNNTSPFMSQHASQPNTAVGPVRYPHDPIFLTAAIEGYKWLVGSNMTDSNGLYVDGYHISGWKRNGTTGNTRCDVRNEMVYTYNQGVLLSGQRGLYEATGSRSYLEDGHKLVGDIIDATGWDRETQSAVYKKGENSTMSQGLGKWYGLGRQGVLEEACDAAGDCSQDGQTFKGILFHHLALFCAQLPDHLPLLDERAAASAHQNTVQDINVTEDVKKYHSDKCALYTPWISHNAKAALLTRNEIGEFGMWWNAPWDEDLGNENDTEVQLPDGAVDYRNLGIPGGWRDSLVGGGRGGINPTGLVSMGHSAKVQDDGHRTPERGERGAGTMDPNDRGRGRTVETQGGGLTVLRASWEAVNR